MSYNNNDAAELLIKAIADSVEQCGLKDTMDVLNASICAGIKTVRKRTPEALEFFLDSLRDYLAQVDVNASFDVDNININRESRKDAHEFAVRCVLRTLRDISTKTSDKAALAALGEVFCSSIAGLIYFGRVKDANSFLKIVSAALGDCGVDITFVVKERD
jgi:hypothetical protein